MRRVFIFIFLIILIVSCGNPKENTISEINDREIFHQSVKSLTNVIVHDIFSPPVASRIYSYASIGAYEVVRHNDSTYMSLAGKIKHLGSVPTPDNTKEYNFQLASTLAYLKIGKVLIFSEDSIEAQIQKVLTQYKNAGINPIVMENSTKYAEDVSSFIIEWSSKDNYKQTRSFPKYSLVKDPATWKPTPPAYMEGIEPSWRLIRTLVMDSAQQFKPAKPTPYDVKNKKSLFYKELTEVYETVKNATPEQIEIANFWDCNPFKMNVTGHVMHATKKISPGGHWINIVALACKKSNADFVKTAQAYAVVSIGLADAFISCWDEKYRSILVRPETVINETIDQEWLPLLQTPPFPEYPSGHSVASGSASTILTYILGDNFAFEDDTEVEFGLPIRNFTSFNQAAEEAAISRLYGGIHYRPAIVNGLIQGRAVGNLVLTNILK